MFYKLNRITVDYKYQLRKIRSGNVSSNLPLSHVSPYWTSGSEGIIVSLSNSQILVSPFPDDYKCVWKYIRAGIYISHSWTSVRILLMLITGGGEVKLDPV